MTYDPVVQKPPADLASRIVWFDAYVTNVDRTFRNTNMLVWHRRIWLIDHGSTLTSSLARMGDGHGASAGAFPAIKDHVLVRQATLLEDVDDAMAGALTGAVLDGVVAMVPEAWLGDRAAVDPAAARAAYRTYLTERLLPPRRVRRRGPVPAEYTYDYAIIRVVPRVERGERINAGVILSCADLHFLEARIELDAPAVLALDPAADVEVIRANLAIIPVVCRGGPEAGPIGELPPCALPLARLAPQHDRAAVTPSTRGAPRRRCVPRAPDGHRREASGGALLRSGISLIARDSRANP